MTTQKWKWYGSPGHFICGRWCRFHLTTEVGHYLISTVGEYVHPRNSAGSEQAEREYLKEHPLGEEIGYRRLYETAVFRLDKKVRRCLSGRCGQCGLPRPSDWTEVRLLGANTAGVATRNHYKMCQEYDDISM